MLSKEVSSIIYKVFWYDTTWDWTQVSRTIGEHSTTRTIFFFLIKRYFSSQLKIIIIIIKISQQHWFLWLSPSRPYYHHQDKPTALILMTISYQSSLSVLYTHDTDTWNRHKESEIHDIHEIGSGTNLYYLWGYSTWGERDTIFLCGLLLHRQLST